MTSENQDNRQQAALRQRALQIIEAASRLVLRLGYQKVTVEDIAVEAGVGKGTVYLHWKSKQQLFYALVAKEMAAVTQELMEFVRRDAENLYLHRLYAQLFLACNQRPLVRALFTQDPRVLGNLVQREASRITQWQKMLSMSQGLARMRECGLVRSDLEPQLQVHTINALLLGMFVLDHHQPNELTDQQKAVGLALVVEKSFEPDRLPPVPPELQEEVLLGFARLLDRYNSVIYQDAEPIGSKGLQERS
jgi:AcrR family transcriptional regulator